MKKYKEKELKDKNNIELMVILLEQLKERIDRLEKVLLKNKEEIIKILKE
jgi:hypothetical protein